MRPSNSDGRTVSNQNFFNVPHKSSCILSVRPVVSYYLLKKSKSKAIFTLPKKGWFIFAVCSRKRKVINQLVTLRPVCRHPGAGMLFVTPVLDTGVQVIRSCRAATQINFVCAVAQDSIHLDPAIKSRDDTKEGYGVQVIRSRRAATQIQVLVLSAVSAFNGSGNFYPPTQYAY